MPKLPALEFGRYSHINRGIHRQNLFFEECNYRYFIALYAQYIEPVAETFAYCLLRNLFHLLVGIKSEEEQRQTFQVSPAESPR